MILLQILYPISLSYVCVYEPLSLFVYISVFCLFVPFSVARFVPTSPPGPPHPTGSGGVVFFFLIMSCCLHLCVPPLWQILFVSLYCVLVFVVVFSHLSGMFCVCLFHVFLYPLFSDRSCVFLFHVFFCVASFVSFFFMCFFVLLTLASLVCFSLLCLTLPTSHRAVCIDWIGSTSNIFPKIETFLSLFVL